MFFAPRMGVVLPGDIMSDFRDSCVSVFVIVFIAFCGGMIGFGITNQHWQNWCVDNGYASYDTKTGELILYDEEWAQEYLKEQNIEKKTMKLLDNPKKDVTI